MPPWYRPRYLTILLAYTTIRSNAQSEDAVVLPLSLLATIPTCAQRCLADAIAQDFSTSFTTCSSFDLDCLCSHYGVDGYTLGERAFGCLKSGDCSEPDDDVVTSAYLVCSEQQDAVTPTHKTVVITPTSALSTSTDAPRTTSGPLSVRPLSRITSATSTPLATDPAEVNSATGTADSNHNKTSLSEGQIAGIAIACIVLVVIATALAACFLLSRKRRAMRQYQKDKITTESKRDEDDDTLPELPTAPWPAPPQAAQLTRDNVGRASWTNAAVPPPIPSARRSQEQTWPRYFGVSPDEPIGIAKTANVPVNDSPPSSKRKSPVASTDNNQHPVPRTPTMTSTVIAPAHAHVQGPNHRRRRSQRYSHGSSSKSANSSRSSNTIEQTFTIEQISIRSSQTLGPGFETPEKSVRSHKSDSRLLSTPSSFTITPPDRLASLSESAKRRSQNLRINIPGPHLNLTTRSTNQISPRLFTPPKDSPPQLPPLFPVKPLAPQLGPPLQLQTPPRRRPVPPRLPSAACLSTDKNIMDIAAMDPLPTQTDLARMPSRRPLRPGLEPLAVQRQSSIAKLDMARELHQAGQGPQNNADSETSSLVPSSDVLPPSAMFSREVIIKPVKPKPLYPTPVSSKLDSDASVTSFEFDESCDDDDDQSLPDADKENDSPSLPVIPSSPIFSITYPAIPQSSKSTTYLDPTPTKSGRVPFDELSPLPKGGAPGKTIENQFWKTTPPTFGANLPRQNQVNVLRPSYGQAATAPPSIMAPPIPFHLGSMNNTNIDRTQRIAPTEQGDFKVETRQLAPRGSGNGLYLTYQ